MKPTAEVIGTKKLLGIYFAASWVSALSSCTASLFDRPFVQLPACTAWTDKLAELYPALQANDMEIIFASRDLEQKGYQDYEKHYEIMPWPEVPNVVDHVRLPRLGRLLGLHHVPCLIVLDARTGEVIEKEGENTVNAVLKEAAVKAVDVQTDKEQEESDREGVRRAAMNDVAKTATSRWIGSDGDVLSIE